MNKFAKMSFVLGLLLHSTFPRHANSLDLKHDYTNPSNPNDCICQFFDCKTGQDCKKFCPKDFETHCSRPYPEATYELCVCNKRGGWSVSDFEDWIFPTGSSLPSDFPQCKTLGCDDTPSSPPRDCKCPKNTEWKCDQIKGPNPGANFFCGCIGPKAPPFGYTDFHKLDCKKKVQSLGGGEY